MTDNEFDKILKDALTSDEVPPVLNAALLKKAQKKQTSAKIYKFVRFGTGLAAMFICAVAVLTYFDSNHDERINPEKPSDSVAQVTEEETDTGTKAVEEKETLSEASEISVKEPRAKASPVVPRKKAVEKAVSQDSAPMIAEEEALPSENQTAVQTADFSGEAAPAAYDGEAEQKQMTFRRAKVAAESEDVTADSTESAPAFSYEQERALHATVGEGVMYDGFVNTAPTPVTTNEEAIERAKAECNAEYTSAEVFRDVITDMWKVEFVTSEGCTSVYMGSDGITKLTVQN